MLFCAEITDLRIIYNVLKSIAIKDFAILRPMQEGLKVTLDDMKCMETSVYIPCNMFSFYQISSDEDLAIKISLKTLVDVLNIFGDDGSPSLKLTYPSLTSPLCILMNHNEENITVDCEIRTMNIEDDSISLADECGLNKVVVNASTLVDLLQKLDNFADELVISITSLPSMFSLKSSGIAGETEVSLSKNLESVTIFKCKRDTTATYCFGNIRHILKVMSYASKVAVSMGESGLLGLQLVIDSEDKHIYVEYYVTSLFIPD